MSGRHRLVVLAVLSGATALIVGLLVLRSRDSWTALVNGEISAGDVLVTSAVPAKHR